MAGGRHIEKFDKSPNIGNGLTDRREIWQVTHFDPLHLNGH